MFRSYAFQSHEELGNNLGQMSVIGSGRMKVWYHPHSIQRLGSKAVQKRLNSNIKYPDFEWAVDGSKEYLDALNDINDMYRKMLRIGKATEAFHDKECPMLTAKTKKDFQKHRDTMNRNYQNYLKTPKAKLDNFSIGTELLPHPRKYGRGPAH